MDKTKTTKMKNDRLRGERLASASVELVGEPMDESDRNVIAALSAFIALAELGEAKVDGVLIAAGTWQSGGGLTWPCRVTLEVLCEKFPDFSAMYGTSIADRRAFAERMMEFYARRVQAIDLEQKREASLL